MNSYTSFFRTYSTLWAIFIFFIAIHTASIAFAAENEPENKPVSVVNVTINAGIGPATADLLRGAIQEAEAGHDMVLVTLNTPGGLVSSMREMVQDILNANVPVGVWVGPSGAHAASAGMFLVAAASINGMAPQTTLGAAIPVTADGSDTKGDLATKVTNDLSSLVSSLAERHNRNVDWYVSAVRKGESLPSSQAIMNNVVEFMATSPKDFLVQAGSRGVPAELGPLYFTEDMITIVPYEPGVRYRFIGWLLDPQVAYLLLIAGVALLFVEFTHPGAILPGVLGALSLLLGLYAMTILPTEAAGLLLIVLGLIFFLLEVKVISFGLLSLAGVAALFFGSLILFPESERLRLPLMTIGPTVLGISAFMGGIVWLAVKSQRRTTAMVSEQLTGQTATVVRWNGKKGTVKLQGTMWNATTPKELPIAKGESVIVTGMKGLTLHVSTGHADSDDSHKGTS
ncbi:NfeD family protein [Oleidesulfovibrio sp.]|uniref:NfeD family protein n=1 Tax=Oleidesulfovibrio sp. TaxID=2909707 RepID=UPI003A8551A2